ncbi:unnamed protein product [Pylaiella littoralis]
MTGCLVFAPSWLWSNTECKKPNTGCGILCRIRYFNRVLIFVWVFSEGISGILTAWEHTGTRGRGSSIPFSRDGFNCLLTDLS